MGRQYFLKKKAVVSQRYPAAYAHMGTTNRGKIAIPRPSPIPAAYPHLEVGGRTEGDWFYVDIKSKSLLLFKFVLPAESGIQAFPTGLGSPIPSFARTSLTGITR